MMVKIFLDDVRPSDIDPRRTIVIRTFHEAVNLFARLGLSQIEYISFDHDLGMADDAEYPKTGHDLAKWIVLTEMDGKHERLPPHFRFRVHSANPVGARNIRMYLRNYFDCCNRKGEAL